MSDSLQLHGLRQARSPCPWLSPRVCSDSCPLSWWCHSTILSSVASFSSCSPSFPTSGSFPVNQCFTSGGQSTTLFFFFLSTTLTHTFQEEISVTFKAVSTWAKCTMILVSLTNIISCSRCISKHIGHQQGRQNTFPLFTHCDLLMCLVCVPWSRFLDNLY